MKVFSRLVVIVFVFLSIEFSFSQGKEFGSISFNKAVNVSGKQRMLTQKMGKIYLYLIDNPDDFKAKRDLKIAKILFEKQLAILEENNTSKKVRKELKIVKDTWEKYKKILDVVPNQKDAIKIINTNSTILKFAHNVVLAIIQYSEDRNTNNSFTVNEDSDLKQVINKSGRQRMLSQRLALYYYATKPNLKANNVTSKLDVVFNEIDDALSFLLISNFNDERVDNALGDVLEIWDKITGDKERLFKHGYSDSEIYEMSNELTKLYNLATNSYEKVRVK